MGLLLHLSLVVLLAAAYPGGRSALRRRAAPAQGSGDSSPAPSETKASFWVRISPNFMAEPPGSSVWLNCSSSCPLPEGFSLRTGLQRGQNISGPSWVSFQLLDVRAWSSNVHCFVTCAGVTRGATARINTYKRPHSVILEPPVLEGSNYTLRCHVTHVFPVAFLVVSLRSGGRVIYSESLERFKGPNLANVTLAYEFPARPRDFWQPVRCHARLSLDGLVVSSRSAPVMIDFAWSSVSKALASTSIAALVVIFLVVGAAYLRKYLLMQSQA